MIYGNVGFRFTGEATHTEMWTCVASDGSWLPKQTKLGWIVSTDTVGQCSRIFRSGEPNEARSAWRTLTIVRKDKMSILDMAPIALDVGNENGHKEMKRWEGK